jgi:hypothetical protein
MSVSDMSSGIVRRAGLAFGLALLLCAPQIAPAAAGKTAAGKTAVGKTTTARSARKAPARSRPAAPPPAAAEVTPLPEPERSEAAARMIAWVAASRDNHGMPYLVIDKQNAALFLFDAQGGYLGQAPVLLGVGVGDDSSPGVGAKKLEEIGPAERTTPAGRFVAKFGKAFGRQRVLWVDYANSVALHAVITTHKAERRVERLLSPGADDNRITFGCINVGTGFYTRQLRPLFQKKGGIVYILPDTRPMDDVFPRVRLLPYLGTASRS